MNQTQTAGREERKATSWLCPPPCYNNLCAYNLMANPCPKLKKIWTDFIAPKYLYYMYRYTWDRLSAVKDFLGSDRAALAQ